MNRHAEIAGAGLGGLSLAVMLRDRDWTVTLHERSAAIREIGAGIYLKENGLHALKAMGILEEVCARATPLFGQQRLDPSGKVIEGRRTRGESKTWCMPREELIQVIHSRALQLEAKIVTGSEVRSASPEGSLTLADGSAVYGDLVVGADGLGSVVRESLGLGLTTARSSTVVTRYLIRSRDLAAEPMMKEYWSGPRRIAFAPSGPEHTYVYVICRDDDLVGMARPMDTASWASSFPVLKDEIHELAKYEAAQHTYPLIRCASWIAGNVALIGDAAHALPPTLGQGANLAMSNSLALATCLDLAGVTSVSEALHVWQNAARPVTETTQAWSIRYDRLTWNWPRGLDGARKRLLWLLGLPRISDHIHVADRLVPDVSIPAEHATRN